MLALGVIYLGLLLGMLLNPFLRWMDAGRTEEMRLQSRGHDRRAAGAPTVT